MSDANTPHSARKFFVGRAISFLVLLVLLLILGGIQQIREGIQREPRDGFSEPAVTYDEPITQEDLILTSELQRADLEGEYLCLPKVATVSVITEECATGIRTDDGEYYVIDFALMSQMVDPSLVPGKRISASGVIIPIERLSTDHWQQYPVKGIFSVTDSVVVR